MANQVKFFRGIKTNYKSTSTHLNAIYFATDTQELLMNGIAYGVNPEDSALLAMAITNVKWTSPKTLTFYRGKNDDGSDKQYLNIVFPDATETESGLMSAAQVIKLKGIEEGAQVNVIENVVVSGLSGTIADKTLTINGLAKSEDVYTKPAAELMVDGKINTALSSVYEYKSSVATYADLPTSADKGDVYNVEAEYREEGIDGKVYPAGTNWAWNGTSWDALGGLVDLTAVNQAIADNAAAIVVNANAISAEKTRAEGIEGGLRTDLGQKTDPENKEGSAFARIAQLRSEMDVLIEGNPESIQSQINTAISNLVNGASKDYDTLGEIETAIKAEAAEARKNEKANADAIAAEQERAEGIEAGLKGRIDGHDTAISDLQKQDETHTADIAANKAAIDKLNGADTVEGSVAKTVKDAVASEAALREAADNALDARVDVLEGLLGDGEGSVADQIADAVAAEAKLRDDADKVLQGNIDKVAGDLASEITRAKGEEKKNADAITALQKLVSDNETDIEGKMELAVGKIAVNEGDITKLKQADININTAITNLQNNTVNGIKISTNPVLTGANVALTDYTSIEGGFVTATDSVNAAIAKLENDLIWHEA